MGFISKYKNIFLAIIVAVILFFAYDFFFGNSSNGGDGLVATNSVGAGSNGTEIIGTEIIQAINQIDSLKLDRTIFEDMVFTSLIDQSRPITPEKVGRSNPFLPISSSAELAPIQDNEQSSNTVESSETDGVDAGGDVQIPAEGEEVSGATTEDVTNETQSEDETAEAPTEPSGPITADSQ